MKGRQLPVAAHLVRRYPVGKIPITTPRPVARFEWYTFTRRFTFTSNLPAQSAQRLESHSWFMGGVADFVWTGINLQQSSATAGIVDPGAETFLGFYSRNGTRPHQSELLRGSLLRGSGRTAGGLNMKAQPFWIEPTFLPRNDTLRVDVYNDRAATGTVDVGVIGFRVFDR